jgi:hypothetical protein
LRGDGLNGVTAAKSGIAKNLAQTARRFLAQLAGGIPVRVGRGPLRRLQQIPRVDSDGCAGMQMAERVPDAHALEGEPAADQRQPHGMAESMPEFPGEQRRLRRPHG